MAGRIVVGVDGSDGSLPALRWAVDEAHRRRATVEAVLVWQAMTALGLGEIPYLPDEEARIVAAERLRLDGVVARALAVVGGTRDLGGTGLGDGDARVQVETVIAEGDAAHVLCERSENADLLVVGVRGHGRMPRLLEGSVSSACMRRSRCPVVLVPHGSIRPAR